MVVESVGPERHLIESRFQPLMVENLNLGRLVSYVANKKVPFLRLYRYKEAFSTALVDHFLDRFGATTDDRVFDPFSGLGTTLFTAMMRGIPSVGIDRLPVAAFASSTLPKFLYLEPGQLLEAFTCLKARLSEYTPAHVAADVPIMGVAFDEETLLRLRQWKSAIDSLDCDLRDPLRLLFFGILENTSYTSKDGQFLRLLRNKIPAWPDNALHQKVVEAEEDIRLAGYRGVPRKPDNGIVPHVELADTRNLDWSCYLGCPTIAITSPPYVNRYDYTRSYCLELCFHFVQDFTELRSLRHSILRSHIESRTTLEDYPNHPVIAEVLWALNRKDLNNARIPQMIMGYFIDMEKAIGEWSRVMAHGAHVALVVDNVRFEGEMIPVDLVLSELAERQGFQIEEILVARYKGNSSQQMGKYGRVPVRESIVVWRKE